MTCNTDECRNGVYLGSFSRCQSCGVEHFWADSRLSFVDEEALPDAEAPRTWERHDHDCAEKGWVCFRNDDETLRGFGPTRASALQDLRRRWEERELREALRPVEEAIRFAGAMVGYYETQRALEEALDAQRAEREATAPRHSVGYSEITVGWDDEICDPCEQMRPCAKHDAPPTYGRDNMGCFEVHSHGYDAVWTPTMDMWSHRETRLDREYLWRQHSSIAQGIQAFVQWAAEPAHRAPDALLIETSTDRNGMQWSRILRSDGSEYIFVGDFPHSRGTPLYLDANGCYRA